MKWITPRQAWHDAFYTPGVKFGGQRTNCTKDSSFARIAHCVEAGQVMCAIEKLPESLKSLGMVLWAPLTFVSVQDFNRAWETVVENFWLENRDEKLNRHTHKVTILAKFAIEEFRFRDTNGGDKLYTLKEVFAQAGIDPSNAKRQGWVLVWNRLLSVLQELADEALRPVSILLSKK